MRTSSDAIDEVANSGLAAEAAAVERAVGAVLADGCRTADIARAGDKPLSTAALGDAVAAKIT